jgi:hypothetical protein
VCLTLPQEGVAVTDSKLSSLKSVVATSYPPKGSTLMWVLRTDASQFATSFTADCDIAQIPGGQWIVTVTQADSVLVADTCESCLAATTRAGELREMLIQQGWTDLPPRDHRWRPSDRSSRLAG